MRALSIIVWLIFAAYTAFWIIKFIKTYRCVAYRESIGAKITYEDRRFFAERKRIAFWVSILFTFTTVVDLLITIF